MGWARDRRHRGQLVRLDQRSADVCNVSLISVNRRLSTQSVRDTASRSFNRLCPHHRSPSHTGPFHLPRNGTFVDPGPQPQLTGNARAIGPSESHAKFYHVFLDLRTFVTSPCAPRLSETAELFFSLYNQVESRFVSEEFCSPEPQWRVSVRPDVAPADAVHGRGRVRHDGPNLWLPRVLDRVQWRDEDEQQHGVHL